MKKILILAVFALCLTACGKTEEVKNTTVSAPAANTQANVETEEVPAIKEETFTAGKDPRADIISAAQKRQKMPFWSAKVLSGESPAAVAEMQYIAPDRYYFKTAAGEAIIIGNGSYSNEDGTWVKEDEGAGEEIKEQIRSEIAESVENLKDVQIAGKEKLNGKNVTVYFYKAGNVSTRIWIADDSGLELKNEIELSSGGMTQKQTTVYDYEKAVKIEAPKVE